MRHVWEVIAVADDRALGSQQNKNARMEQKEAFRNNNNVKKEEGRMHAR